MNNDRLMICDGQNWRFMDTANAEGRCTETRPLFRDRTLRYCGSGANNGKVIDGILTVGTTGSATDSCAAASFGTVHLRTADRSKIYYCNGSAWVTVALPYGFPDFKPHFGDATVADQTYTVGTAIAPLVLPEAEGGDGTLTYTLATLPDGLEFTASTRTLSGTPTAAGTTTVTYKATDADSSNADSHTLSFDITVDFPPPTGLVVRSGTGKLDLSWSAPAGATVTGYDVHYTSSTTEDADAAAGTNAATGWVAVDRSSAGTSVSQAITGLHNGTPYRLRVRAKDASSRSTWVVGEGTPVAVVTLSVSPNPVDEGASVTVTATLSGVFAGDVTIPLTLTDGTTEPADHGTLASITVAAGKLGGTGTIATHVDTGDGEDETFTVAVDADSLPTGVRAGSPSSVTVTIRNRTVRLLPSSGALSVEEGTKVGIEVTMPRVGGTVYVPLLVRHGTSEEGDWGHRTTRRGPFGADAHPDPHSYYSRGWFSIATNRDSDSDDETFTIELDTANLPAGYEAGTPSKVTVTVRDADEPSLPPLTLTATPNPVAEGEPVVVTAYLSAVSAVDVTVPLMAARGTSEEDDHAMRASVTIPAGRCCRWVKLATHRDADGDDETFTVTVDPDNVPTGYRRVKRSSVEVHIADDGAARAAGTVPAVSLSASPDPVPEGGAVRVTARLSAALARDVTVPLTVSRVTSEEHDHGTLAGLFIRAGGLSATGTIATRRDPDTDDERFTVSLGTLPADLRAGRPSSVGVRIADSGNDRLGWLEMRAGN